MNKIFYLTIIALIIINGVSLAERSINETEYWGVVVVALGETLEPHIYNGLLESNIWHKDNIILLWKQNATREGIIESLGWLKDNVDENDIVLFSFDGHGSYIDQKYGIYAYEGGEITVEELDYYFDQINVNNLCLIFDCCFAVTFVDDSINKNLKDNNRVILMSTMKYGLGSHWIDTNLFTGEKEDTCLSSKLAEAWTKKIDENNDGICSVEESFIYAKRGILPLSIMTASRLMMQIGCYLAYRHFYLPFPTIYDNNEGDIPIAYI